MPHNSEEVSEVMLEEATGRDNTIEVKGSLDKDSAASYPDDLAPRNHALLRNINTRLGNQIYGHQRSRLLTFVVALSSKTPYHLALILVGDPGAAKTTVVRVVLANFDSV